MSTRHSRIRLHRRVYIPFLIVVLFSAAVYGQENPPQEELIGGLGSGRFNIGFSLDTFSENDELWTSLNITPEMPLWKFMFGLDVNLLLDSSGQLSTRN